MIEYPIVFAMDITAQGGDGEIPIPCTMKYNPEQPLEVVLTFHVAQGNNDWVFARDILIEGVQQKSGDGDVTAWPQGEKLHMIFKSHIGKAKLWCEREAMQEFVTTMVTQVPVGEETYDFDRELKSLLEG